MLTFVDGPVPKVGFKSSSIPGTPACGRIQALCEGGSLSQS